ncbi:NECA1 protein, partial [Oreocharis arfaki]|nr:NECA1 protein [Oreocharis arfaki]
SDDGKLSFDEFKAYFADGVLSGEELHELFCTIDTHNTESFVGDVGFFLLLDYFSKHLGEYENVLSVLEDLNITILKAMGKTKKVSKNSEFFFALFILFIWSISSSEEGLRMGSTEKALFRWHQESQGPWPQDKPRGEDQDTRGPWGLIWGKGGRREQQNTAVVLTLKISIFFSIASKDLKLEPPEEEVLEENARSHIMIVQHQMSVIEEKVEEFRLALKQYVESASAQGGCLHVSIQKLPSNFRFIVYEFWESSNAWNSHLQKNYSKAFQRSNVDFLETPELITTMLVPGKYQLFTVF